MWLLEYLFFVLRFSIFLNYFQYLTNKPRQGFVTASLKTLYKFTLICVSNLGESRTISRISSRLKSVLLIHSFKFKTKQEFSRQNKAFKDNN
jgi:hypothetical protein